MTAALALSLAALASVNAADLDGAPAISQQAAPAPAPSPPSLNRLEVKLQPFLGLTGNSWGGIGEARFEHDFSFPLTLGLELSPVALASSGEGTGALAEGRVTGAFSTRYLSIGLGVGGQLQRFGRNGLSIAPQLRLGRRDGLSLEVEYAYSVAANQYTGQRTIGFSNIMGTFRVPLTSRLALQIDGGLNLQAWAFATVGLRHRLIGDGGPGSWFVSAGLGAAWVSEESGCNYDAVIPCGPSATSFGPTVGFGLERRF
jgi:opacity protein-like surface antigen